MRNANRPNLFPDEIPEMRAVVLEWMERMEALGQRIMRAIAQALAMPADTFAAGITREPLCLFRIFHYPPLDAAQQTSAWSVGEHTDYGLLTILLQDACGGLQVQARSGAWLDAPHVEGTFVCNIGDMLEKISGGVLRSTPHRVRNASGLQRISAPFFFDPGWEAEVKALTGFAPIEDDSDTRWDGASVHATSGTYGAYLLSKVAKVFPQLIEVTEQSNENQN